MSSIQVIDTFEAFLASWSRIKDRPIEEQIEAWVGDYMSTWPDLLAAQIENYAAEGSDWRQVAREKVFPFLAERLPAMQKARQSLLEVKEEVFTEINRTFGFDREVLFVLYVGLGCGAGWGTTFRELPAVLFGLENIAECGWSGAEAAAGLMAHEMGHLIHQCWRKENAKQEDSGSWWQLFEEGFAQHYESLVLGPCPWHQTCGTKDSGWMEWCRSHRGWLAAEFLRRVKAGESTTSFFGSWSSMEGHIETGYYLGNEVIGELAKQFSLREIALLEDVEFTVRPILRRFAAG